MAGWTVQLVAYGTDGKFAYVAQVPVRYDAATDMWTANIGNDVHLRAGRQQVDHDDGGRAGHRRRPEETATAYPKYTLTANGATQPGGS